MQKNQRLALKAAKLEQKKKKLYSKTFFLHDLNKFTELERKKRNSKMFFFSLMFHLLGT